ncbi:hypothetical protein MKX03_016475 [Papaver bracteatum]|nr:hypothetical protein MKX03_016475 [Papaver bracteatum]
MEGLKAMDKEANHAASDNAGMSMPTIMNPNNSLVQQRPTSAGRFDYCKDTMVPSSANKRTKNHMYHTPPPSYQPHRAFEPIPHHSPNSWRSPRLNLLPITVPVIGNLGPQPQAWNRPGGTGGYYCHPSNSTIGGYRAIGSGRGFHPRPGLNYPYHRRGSNYTFSNSPRPGTGRGSGRGRGSHACTSARERPEMFYNKSMMEDPWTLLKPVVRNSVGTEDWLPKELPKSITKKRPRTSGTTCNSCSQ